MPCVGASLISPHNPSAACPSDCPGSVGHSYAMLRQQPKNNGGEGELAGHLSPKVAGPLLEKHGRDRAHYSEGHNAGEANSELERRRAVFREAVRGENPRDGHRFTRHPNDQTGDHAKNDREGHAACQTVCGRLGSAPASAHCTPVNAHAEHPTCYGVEWSSTETGRMPDRPEGVLTNLQSGRLLCRRAAGVRVEGFHSRWCNRSGNAVKGRSVPAGTSHFPVRPLRLRKVPPMESLPEYWMDP
jgi:hypothetical protein